VRCGDRVVTSTEIHFIQETIREHPDWGRMDLALHLCREWDWRRPEGALNDQACRTFSCAYTRGEEKHRIAHTDYRLDGQCHEGGSREILGERDGRLSRQTIRPLELDELLEGHIAQRMEMAPTRSTPG